MSETYIKSVELKDDFIEENLKDIVFEIDKRDGFVFHTLVTTSNSNSMAIVLRQVVLHTFTILVWDLRRNVELVTFEVKAPFLIKNDNEGFFYVVTKNGVIFTKMNCKLTAFDYDLADLQEIYERNQEGISNIERSMSVGIDGN